MPIPTIVWKATRTTFTGGRSSRRTASRPCDDGVRVVVGEQRQQLAGSRSPTCTSPSSYQPPMWIGAPRLGFAQALERRELRRLVLGDLAGGPVADDDLHRRGERGDGERHEQRGAHVAARAARAATPHA